MKDVIFRDSIHYSEIEIDECMVCYKEEKPFGVILNDGSQWKGRNNSGDNWSDTDLKEVVRRIFPDCKIRVL